MRIKSCLIMICLTVLVLLGKTYAADPDLVVYLSMDEDQGDLVADTSGNGHDGEIIGDAQWIDGKYGRAIELVTAEAEIQIPDDPALDQLPAMTIEIWVRQDTHQATGIIQKGGNWPDISYLLQPWSDQQIYFGIQDTASRAITKPGDYPLEEWYHLAGTYDGETLIIYINGEEKASAPAPVDQMPDTIEALQVGNRLMGAIDDFVMYSRALTEAEIERDMSGIVMPVERKGKLTITWGLLKERRNEARP
jgi:hypothetical protein